MQTTFKVEDYGSEAATWLAATNLAMAEIEVGNRVFVNQNFGRWNKLWAIVVETEEKLDLGPLRGVKIA